MQSSPDFEGSWLMHKSAGWCRGLSGLPSSGACWRCRLMIRSLECLTRLVKAFGGIWRCRLMIRSLECLTRLVKVFGGPFVLRP